MRRIWSVRLALETAARRRRSAAAGILVAFSLALLIASPPAFAHQPVPESQIGPPGTLGSGLQASYWPMTSLGSAFTATAPAVDAQPKLAPKSSVRPLAGASAPVWLPIRSTVTIGCVKTNCAGPYHGYWAIDLLNPQNKAGDPIYAAGGGKVHILETGTGCGPLGSGTKANAVQVDHGGGLVTWYYHLQSFLVSEGQEVDQNTELGTMDSTGMNEPCPTNHLHFEELQNGTPVYFGSLMACHGGTLVSYPEALGFKNWDEIFPFKYTIYSDGNGCTKPLEIATRSLPAGTPGKHYATSLTATGGAGGYKWKLSSGALQAGLALTASGEISGTPKWPGTVSVSVSVTDAEGHTKSQALVLKVGAEHEELFALASDGSVWHDYFIPGSSSWSGWGTLGGASGVTLRSDVSVGYNQSGSEELFARASDGSVWHDYFIPGSSSWSGWGSLGGASGVTLRSDVSVGYNQSGSEELFARASDGSVWHDYFIPGTSSWSGWGSLGGASGVTLRSDVSVGYNQSGSEELFARASDGSVWHDYFIPGSSSWSGWYSLGAPSSATLVSNVSVGYNSSGEEELFARASDGSVWHDYFIPGSSSWSGWGTLGSAAGATLQSDVSVGYNASGNEELFARASDGSVWHDYFIPGSSSWSGWGSLGSAAGATLQSNVSIGYNQSGSEELFARASDGSVWHDYFIPGSSSWSGWGSLAGASGVTLRSDVSTSESATPLAALGSGPTAMTGAATAVSPVAEELAGSVNPNGETVSECRFEYGSTASYGSSMSCSPSPGEGKSPVAVSAAIAGLTPRTVYHFRTVATNATGTSYGGDETFTTLPLTASESTNRGSSQNGGATSGPTPSHSVLASKTRRSASLLSRAITKCRKIKNRHSRARCIARAKKHYGPDHRHLGGRGRGRR
jgi:Peptidase family M23/Putative Ig domain